jgi:hypothetical protein
MNLEFLTREATDSLAREVANNIPAYRLGQTAGLIKQDESKRSRVEVVSPPDLLDEHGECKSDAEASKLVFQWLSHLTPVQASDERLWVLLSHREFGAYVHKRWAGKRFESATKPDAVVLDRWFYRGQGLRTCVHNGLSRLWWFGHLTYDAKRANPFELTDILLSLQDIQTAFLERSLGPCAALLKTVLETLRNFEKDLREASNTGDLIQEWAKEIRLFGGSYLIDEVPEERLSFVLENTLRSRLRP